MSGLATLYNFFQTCHLYKSKPGPHSTLLLLITDFQFATDGHHITLGLAVTATLYGNTFDVNEVGHKEGRNTSDFCLPPRPCDLFQTRADLNEK